MSADDALDKALASGIKKAADDSGSFHMHDPEQLIEADRYVKAKEVDNPFACVRKARGIAAGPVQ